jgi:hypothetical protein
MGVKVPEPGKRCPQCGIEKPLNEYYKRCSRPDGRERVCIACYRERRARNRGLRTSTREEQDALFASGRKRCARCGAIEPLSDYTVDRARLGGRDKYCKVCKNAQYECKTDYRERKAAIDDLEARGLRRCTGCGSVKALESFSGRARVCKECQNDKQRRVYATDQAVRSRSIQRATEYYLENRRDRLDYMNARRRRLYREDPRTWLDDRMSNQIYLSLRKNKGGRGWESLVGYTLDDLIAHLEQQFDERMSWSNAGQWHIDHILCKAVFRYESPSDPEFALCWSLENLAPVWGPENTSKSDLLPDGRRARNLSEDERLDVIRGHFGS